jgi:hypothetical protein
MLDIHSHTSTQVVPDPGLAHAACSAVLLLHSPDVLGGDFLASLGLAVSSQASAAPMATFHAADSCHRWPEVTAAEWAWVSEYPAWSAI